MPTNNDERVTVLLLASGFKYSKNNGQNLGDVAQQQSGVNGLLKTFKNPKILAVANSINETSDLDNTEFSKKLIMYLSAAAPAGIFSRILPRRVTALVHAVLLLWNAKRARDKQRPIFLSKHGLDALDELLRADAVFASGAGNFNDVYMSGIGFFWATILKCADILGIPAVLSGQQIGPLNKLLTRAAATWGLKAARIVGVREPVSYDVAYKMGITKDRIVLTGDEAWSLEPASTDAARAVLISHGIGGPFIAAQFRFDTGTQWTEDDASVLAACLDGISNKLGLPVIFVPMFYSDSRDDRTAARVIGSVMQREHAIIETRLGAALTKAVLGEAAISVGASNHFCVFSASMGSPTLCLYRSPYLGQKLEGLSKIWPHVICIPFTEQLTPETFSEQAAGLIKSSPKSGPIPAVSDGPFRMQPEVPLSTLKALVESRHPQ